MKSSIGMILAAMLVVLSLFVQPADAWTTATTSLGRAAVVRRTASVAAVAGVRRAEGVRLAAAVAAPAKDKVEEKKDSIKEDEKTKAADSTKRGGWAVRLFNDPMNKREFVALCLSKIAGLSDGKAYQVMMQAHKNGVSVIGRYDFEKAEAYKTALCGEGLTCDMIPVEED